MELPSVTLVSFIASWKWFLTFISFKYIHIVARNITYMYYRLCSTVKWKLRPRIVLMDGQFQWTDKFRGTEHAPTTFFVACINYDYYRNLDLVMVVVSTWFFVNSYFLMFCSCCLAAFRAALFLATFLNTYVFLN